MLKSTTKLHIPESEIETNLIDSDNLENQIIQRFEEKNPSRFNSLISSLIRTLKIEKLEDETALTFEDRLLSEIKNIIKV